MFVVAAAATAVAAAAVALAALVAAAAALAALALAAAAAAVLAAVAVLAVTLWSKCANSKNYLNAQPPGQTLTRSKCGSHSNPSSKVSTRACVFPNGPMAIGSFGILVMSH